MGVEVDEARADHVIGGVDDPRRCDGADVTAQNADGFTFDADGAVKADVAGAVEDLAAGDQEIKHGWRMVCGR